jgi:hypothetical protein
MRWEDERYVRLYTRDTADWLALSFDAQAVFALLLRKVDRAGILVLGKHGHKAVALALGHRAESERIDAALDELLADGCIVVDGDRLVVRNFIEAQETPAGDAKRLREFRERARARKGRETESNATAGTGNEVKRDETGCNADETKRNDRVTPNCAVPNQTTTARARGSLDQGEDLGRGAVPVVLFPQAAALRQRLLQAFALTAGLKFNDQTEAVEAGVKRLGVDRAFELCREAGFAAKKREGRWPNTLGYFAGVLAQRSDEAPSKWAAPVQRRDFSHYDENGVAVYKP